MISDFVEAVRFLTIFPLPSSREKTELARAMFFFPLIGFLIGILSLALVKALSLDLFLRLEALGLVTFPILLTAGLHVDGLADFSDGLAGGKDREKAFSIMRDARVGVWGVLGVILVLFWKWELLTSLSARGPVCVFSLTASRWAQVILAYFLPYANPCGGLGGAVAKKVKIRELAGATASFALLVFFLKGPGLLCVISLLPFLMGIGFLFHKRFGGITGDLLGAASEMTEVFVLLVFFLIRSGDYR